MAGGVLGAVAARKDRLALIRGHGTWRWHEPCRVVPRPRDRLWRPEGTIEVTDRQKSLEGPRMRAPMTPSA